MNNWKLMFNDDKSTWPANKQYCEFRSTREIDEVFEGCYQVFEDDPDAGTFVVVAGDGCLMMAGKKEAYDDIGDGLEWRPARSKREAELEAALAEISELQVYEPHPDTFCMEKCAVDETPEMAYLMCSDVAEILGRVKCER